MDFYKQLFNSSFSIDRLITIQYTVTDRVKRVLTSLITTKQRAYGKDLKMLHL